MSAGYALRETFAVSLHPDFRALLEDHCDRVQTAHFEAAIDDGDGRSVVVRDLASVAADLRHLEAWLREVVPHDGDTLERFEFRLGELAMQQLAPRVAEIAAEIDAALKAAEAEAES